MIGKKFYKGILFLFFTNAILSQSKFKTDIDALDEKVTKICSNTKEKTFCKAYNFYLEKKFDSCYVYSSKAFLKTTSKEEQNILNYIQGVSATKKNLFKKSLQNFHAISDLPSFKNLKNLKLGRTYLSLKNYDKAIYHYLEWERNKAKTSRAFKKNAYHNLGISYVHKKEYANAEKYFSKELELINQKDTLEIITIKIDLANIYYNEFKDNKAIPLFKESYELAKSFSNIDLKEITARNMAVVEKNRKRYKESVNYYIEYIKWKDSIWNRDKIWELTERDKQISINQKQQEIILQDEKLKRQKIQRDGLIIGASSLLIFLLFLSFFYKKLKGKNKLITTQKEELHTINKTKDYLFSVISHDLRSPINAIRKQHDKLSFQIAEKDFLGIKKTIDIAITLSKGISHLLNNVLHWSLEQNEQLLFNKKVYALKPLIEQLMVDFESFAKVQQISINTELDSSILINVDKESLKIVLRNILDNAIKYTPEKGEISITTRVISENISIEITDTGAGISKEQLAKINALKEITIDKIDRSKGIGLGLLLTQTLVKKNNGVLHIESKVGSGTKMQILLPIVRL